MNPPETTTAPTPAPAAAYPAQRLKLLYNPSSGAASPPDYLQTIIGALQAANYLPEVTLVQPGIDIRTEVKNALRRGYRLFVAAGGDGTIDSVAAALAGTQATLALVPAGTRNNVAFSLGIPEDPAAAIGLLRTGRRLKIDLGLVDNGLEKRVFLEACSVGLLSALFPATDDIQHGNLGRLGDLLATLISSPASEIHLTVDGQPPVRTHGHIVLAANMLFVGPRFRVAPDSLLDDNHLDLVVYADLTKMDLLGSVIKSATGGPEDDRILRYKAQRMTVETDPPMPLVVDGFPMDAAPRVRLGVRRQALTIVAAPEVPPDQALTGLTATPAQAASAAESAAAAAVPEPELAPPADAPAPAAETA